MSVRNVTHVVLDPTDRAELTTTFVHDPLTESRAHVSFELRVEGERVHELVIYGDAKVLSTLLSNLTSSTIGDRDRTEPSSV